MADALRLRKRESPIKSLTIPGVIESARAFPQLQILDLSGNRIGNEGCNAIVAYLQSERCKLKKSTLDITKSDMVV